ncbi:serine/threonine-protein kinase [Novipirellula caenicola]|uniref:Serine/threonine-protein kinase PknD n=1 Tax=Novipirellula caenicola TaxID=1536901 RepID=A0ABP9W0A4_9BACT
MTTLLGKLEVESNHQPGSLAKDRRPFAETHVSHPTTSSMSFTYPSGSTPLDRYTIRRGIGMGGFGEVYFAVSEAGKEVALKRIQRNLEVELRGVSHCLNLKHPHLIALYDICRDDQEQAWVVMEYVAGQNLRQVLDQSPSGLDVTEVRRWLSGIAAGVDHLHGAGLVHRDLKPGNVFDDMGIVKVGDYGLSKFISASHRGGHTESVGTFHYMAPEIGRGEYGREIDIYAIGIMTYELLTGTVPFDGESCHEIIVKHMTAKPDVTVLAEPYRSVVAKCLEKDPANRFRSVREMTNALGITQTGPAAIHADAIQPNTPDAPIVATLANANANDSVSSKSSFTAKSSAPTGGRPQSPTAAVHHANVANDSEPLARAVRASVSDLQCWWHTLDRSPGAKFFLLIVATFVLIINTHWLLPLMSIVGVVYVPYYIVRQMVLHVSQQPSYAQAQRIATNTHGPARPMTRSQWRSQMRNDLCAKRSVHRAAELSTSWITAILTTLALTITAGVIGLRTGTVDSIAIAPYGWMAVVVMAAAISILGLGKLWERDEGESLPRRIVLAGVGGGVGLFAYAMNGFLMLPIDAGLARNIDSTTLPQALYSDGIPRASAMMAHFAILFALLRWWRPVDPLRRHRLSLWSVAVAVVGEWAVHQLLPIPQPFGMLIAGGIAIAIQMSAPWINPRVKPERIPQTPSQPAIPRSAHDGIAQELANARGPA